MEQDFHGNFQVNVTCFFAFSLVSLTELSSFWYGLKDLFTLLIRTKLFLSLAIKTDNFTGGKKDVDPHGRLQTAQGRMG